MVFDLKANHSTTLLYVVAWAILIEVHNFNFFLQKFILSLIHLVGQYCTSSG